MVTWLKTANPRMLKYQRWVNLGLKYFYGIGCLVAFHKRIKLTYLRHVSQKDIKLIVVHNLNCNPFYRSCEVLRPRSYKNIFCRSVMEFKKTDWLLQVMWPCSTYLSARSSMWTRLRLINKKVYHPHFTLHCHLRDLIGWKWSHNMKQPIRMLKFQHWLN